MGWLQSVWAHVATWGPLAVCAAGGRPEGLPGVWSLRMHECSMCQRHRATLHHRVQVRREVAAEVGDAYIPPIPNWDSNVITPGTAFMAKLASSLRAFLRAKLAADPAWQHIQVRCACPATACIDCDRGHPGSTGGRPRLSTGWTCSACAQYKQPAAAQSAASVPPRKHIRYIWPGPLRVGGTRGSLRMPYALMNMCPQQQSLRHRNDLLP